MTLRRVAGVVEGVDELLVGGEEQLAGDGVDDGGAVGVDDALDVDQVRDAAGEDRHRGQHAERRRRSRGCAWRRCAPTVTSMTTVSPPGMPRSVAGATLCQSKVETDTRIITATSAAIGMTATTLPRPTTRISRNAPAQNVEMRVRAPRRLHVDHRLADHRAARHAAEEAGDDVGDALAARLAVLVGAGLGDVVDELGGHQRLEQADRRERERVRER